MKNILVATTLLAATLLGCAKSTDPVMGSQTHFLQTCDDSCPAPYDCICGVCTVECSEDAMCSTQASAAQCVAPASASCSELESVCDVSCERDRECEPLGADFECSDGRCRQAPGPLPADAGSDADTTPDERGRLCDGSQDMRVGYTSEGGAVETTYELTNPYGHAFLFIDGECNYYVSTDYREGMRAGQLTPQQRDDLEREIEWDAIEELAAEVDDESCPDAGEVAIWAPGSKVACTCGCDETDVGARKAAALQHIYDLMTTLMGEGEPGTGPLLAIASPNGGIPDATAWPLDRSLDAIPDLIHDVYVEGVDAFAVFDRNVDIESLRALRYPAQAGRVISVSDTSGTYELYMRDALLPGVQARIDALRGIAKPPDPEMGALCDGSDDIRLGLTTPIQRGGLLPDPLFTQPYYGRGFLYVDGHCNFWLRRDYVQGIGARAMNENEAREVEEAIRWQTIGRMALEPDLPSCSDGGDTRVSTPRTTIACDCECDGPNAQLAEVIGDVEYQIGSTLYPSTGALETSVRAVAVWLNDDVAGTTAMWPLDQPIAAYDGLVYAGGDNLEGLLFDDPADAAALRLARNGQSIEDDGLIVQDGEAVYTVFIVDVLPSEVEARIERFREGNP